MSDYCLYPKQCGIGMNCSECEANHVKMLKDEITRLQSENAELKKRIVQAIDAVAANKCSSHEDWAQGVNDATGQHADNLTKMFADIYGSSEQ